jgi:hypothetical protein
MPVGCFRIPASLNKLYVMVTACRVAWRFVTLIGDQSGVAATSQLTTDIERTHMKKTIIAMILLGVILAGHADAKPRGPFGLGIIIGEPTGIDAKYFLNANNAIEGALAWSLSGNNEFHIQCDYLYHNYTAITVSKGQLPIFFGLGGRIAFKENTDDQVGIRIPVGLAYEFEGGIFDVFGEIVPVLELIPDTEFELEGALGVRFWF